jgi:CBS domain-containing membrane protein
MVKNLGGVSSTAPIRDVAQILQNNKFHALPVIDNWKLVGIVTSTDLINYLIDQF